CTRDEDAYVYYYTNLHW
nr:immunoglobulin heavy chain junction region [Macaca mulatta]MOX91573.1 immunoglobulin heavy chain junction region [Macaca mulatta]MOX91780.1 immunoglobulin heavy chain junction region [Macaca mulatta]MOX91797.1 immunoglobulin heavy chain junction region [Macaca mulatta]MOX91970.1 immunoglobulin heavy chain junction region [Macaca mulatta]